MGKHVSYGHDGITIRDHGADGEGDVVVRLTPEDLLSLKRLRVDVDRETLRQSQPPPAPPFALNAVLGPATDEEAGVAMLAHYHARGLQNDAMRIALDAVFAARRRRFASAPSVQPDAPPAAPPDAVEALITGLGDRLRGRIDEWFARRASEPTDEDVKAALATYHGDVGVEYHERDARVVAMRETLRRHGGRLGSPFTLPEPTDEDVLAAVCKYHGYTPSQSDWVDDMRKVLHNHHARLADRLAERLASASDKFKGD